MATVAAATVEGGERGGELADAASSVSGRNGGGERGGELAAAASSVSGRKGGGERGEELAAAASSVSERKGGGERGGELAAAASSVSGRKGGGERGEELAAAASSVSGRKGGGERGGELAAAASSVSARKGGGERGGELAAAASSVSARKGGGERGGELAAAASSVSARKGGGEGNNNDNDNNNAGGGAAAAEERRKAQFLEVYQLLKKELLSDSDLFKYSPESRSWVEEMLDYNVPGGKLNRGISVIDSLSLLKGGDEKLSDEDVIRACALGWCIEWMQASFLVEDDIMDNSVTRRGQPCWYRVPKVGLIAINDGIVLQTHICRILRTHFRKSPIYSRLLEIFNDVQYQTASGQMLDLVITPGGEVDLSKYVLPRYLEIVKYKTAYYSFYLPVACALLLAGERDEHKFEAAKEILLKMGAYFQAQDDFLDCFGAPEVIGKIGTDIQDTKCSWLIVQALKRADDIQKKLLKDNYGKADHSSVEKVKKVYNELQLQKVFEDYENESHSQLLSEIEKQDDQRLQAVLKSFLAKIYKRQK